MLRDPELLLQQGCEGLSGSLRRERKILILAAMPDSKSSPLESLLKIMARLRDPDDGCPWDVEQTFETIAPYTLEEAYEVDHAIRTCDMESLCDELGDLLLQVVFHAQMADEAGHFAFDDVAAAICDKLIRRHPHVFGDLKPGGKRQPFRSAEDQTRYWEESKARERASRAADREEPESPFEGIPRALPALARAAKLKKRASRLPDPQGVTTLDPKPERELDFSEFDRALEGLVLQSRTGDDAKDVQAQQMLGRALSRCVDAARSLGVNPEAALAAENFEFESRVEQAHARGVARDTAPKAKKS